MSAALRIDELVVADDGDAWRAAGFRVDDDGCARIATLRVRCTGAPSEGRRGIRSWIVGGVATASIDGLEGELADPDPAADRAADPAADPASVETHPNTTIELDHVVIATPDIDRTIAAFVDAGCEPRRERVGGSDGQPLRQVFLRAGEVVVEVVGPPVPPEASERRARPATFWGLAFTVADLDACVASLGDACGRAKDAVQPGRRIATLRHDALGLSVPIAFMSPAP